MVMKAQEEKTNDKYWKVEATKRETRREEINCVSNRNYAETVVWSGSNNYQTCHLVNEWMNEFSFTMYNTEISGILLFLSQQLKPYFKRVTKDDTTIYGEGVMERFVSRERQK